MDRKTARKYALKGGRPGETAPHTWRTREDPFEGVTEEIEMMLENEPRIQAKSILEELLARHPGQFAENQLRTLQRMVGKWKRKHGKESRPEIYFAQRHEPGRLMQVDWFHPKSFAVTIGGEPYAHLLGHVVLTYSNWESVTVCRSESFFGLKGMVQDGLWKLGGAPAICQSDNSSTATHRLTRKGEKRGFNTEYLSLVNYYGVGAEAINLRAANENGDVESSHSHLRAAIRDGLSLRGYSDFGSVIKYQGWLDDLTDRRNRPRAGKLKEEQAVMRALPGARLPEYREVPCRVNKYGMARIGKGSYSVPSKLRGRPLRARIHENRVELWEEGECVMRCEETGALRGGAYVNWRHLIMDLCRKPGAFERYRYHQWFFPGEIWKKSYEHLSASYSVGRAGNDYVHLLAMCLEHGQERMEELLVKRLEGGGKLNLDLVRADVGEEKRHIETGVQEANLRVDLSEYDECISGRMEEEGEESNEEEVRCG